MLMKSRRYPEDIYTGTGTAPEGGNPWFLATATMAELFYKATLDFNTAGEIVVTNTSSLFWNYFAPNAALGAGHSYPANSFHFKAAVGALEGWADAFMRRVKFHKPEDGRFTEEYDRKTGEVRGAADLTWSYASIITASMARARLMNDTSYATGLANLGFV
jgi:glucoamylase